MDESVRFLVADDHPIYRQGVVAVIRSVPQYTVCAEACDAEEAWEGLQREKPDVVLVDSFLAGENGLDLIRRIMDARPRMKTLVLSIHDEAIHADRALKAAACGYVVKHEAGTVLLEAIRTVLAGGTYVSPAVRRAEAVGDGDPPEAPASPAGG